MAILYGTQSNGETLPVLVDQFGNLSAKGLRGEAGPPGAPGIGQLPPDPYEGAILGWQDGELAWIGGSTILPEGTYGPFTYVKESGSLDIPQNASALVNGQQLYMSDELGVTVVAQELTDQIANVSSDGLVLTFPTSKNFDKFAVGDIAQVNWNQSQDWSAGADSSWYDPYSNGTTYLPSRLFDGDEQVGGFCGGSTNGTITMNVQITSSFRVKGFGSVGSWKVTIDGVERDVEFTSSGGQGLWTVVPSTGQLTRIRNVGNAGGVSALEIDGSTLVNTGIVPPTNLVELPGVSNSQSITAIDASGPFISVTGGKWLGTDGSGVSDGETKLEKYMSGQGSVFQGVDQKIILRNDNKEWVDGFYVTSPEQRVAARKVAFAAKRRKTN
jgi:hypothetical protein